MQLSDHFFDGGEDGARADQLDGRLDLGRRGGGRARGPRCPPARSRRTTAPVAGDGLQRRAQVERAGRGEHLDRRRTRVEPVDRAAQLAGGRPAHRDVVLLHRAGGDRVDGGRHREPLQLRDDRGLGVLRDHVPAVDAGVVGEERRQPVVAGLVEEPVGTPLADRGDVGGDDREEVEHVGDRRAVEVAVGLDPALVGEHDRVVDGRGQLAAGDRARRARRCRGRRRAPAASSAASRRPGPGCSPARGARRRRRSRPARAVRLAAESAWPGCGRIACSSGAKTRSVPSWPSTRHARRRRRRCAAACAGRRSPSPACRACRRCR